MIIFTVSRGMRGYYAMCFDTSSGECIQTGIGSFSTPEEAAIEAVEWAISECNYYSANKLIKKFNLNPQDFGLNVNIVNNVIDEL